MSAETSGNSTIDLSAFEAKCLQLIDEVAESGTEIIITRNGQPVARLVPYRKRVQDWLDANPGIEILGDIISPIDVEWEAETDPDRVLNPKSA